MAYIYFLGTVAVLYYLYMTVAYIGHGLGIFLRCRLLGFGLWVVIYWLEFWMSMLGAQIFANISEKSFQRSN